jgi:SAM-dependent methyltransferase
MSVFGDYSKYYDLLYQDKDYEAEARYVDTLIKKYSLNARSMLEFGCGTGRYTREFSRLGYAVHGVDFSEGMLAEAREKSEGIKRLRFSCGDMRSVRLGEKFDVVAALFHVLSYQTTNQDVLDAFKTVKEHLAPEGIAVLDFWYGPAVLTQRPEIRIKEVENKSIKIIRIAEPEMIYSQNTVDVDYHTFIFAKATIQCQELRESHRMRYFFLPELQLVLDSLEMLTLFIAEWKTEKAPKDSSWAAVIVCKRR